MENPKNSQNQKQSEVQGEYIRIHEQLPSFSEQASLIQHGEQQQVPLRQKLKLAIDIFAFLPVPKTNPVSTNRSFYGSLLLLVLFIGYVVYQFALFLVQNYPSMGQFVTKLSNEQVSPPEMVIGFVYGTLLNETFYDENYFTISMQQVIKQAGSDDVTLPIPLSHDYCGDLDWIGYPFNNKTQFPDLLCVDPKFYANKTLLMQGLLYSSRAQQFPRFSVSYCDRNKFPTKCADETELKKVTSGGRIFLFVRQQPSKNYATGKVQKDIQNFFMQYFFLVPTKYNRAELIMQLNNVKIHPDLLTQFSTQEKQELNFKSMNFYESDVSVYSNTSAFQIWMRLDAEVVNIDIVYQTIIDQVSIWGAFWSVLFSVFALYFLRFNSKKFYDKNPQWDQFDAKTYENIDSKQQSQIQAHRPKSQSQNQQAKSQVQVIDLKL